MNEQRFRGHLIGALLVALLLRLIGVTDATLTQWDEGPYAGAAMDKGPAVREDPRIVYAPPLFPGMCGALYQVFGEDPRLAIGLAGVLGALTVLAAAALARLLFGVLAGVFAAWILALEPISIAHSRLALTESTFTLLTLIGIIAAILTLRSGKARDAVFLGLIAGLTTTTKFHGFLPLAVFVVVAAWDAMRSPDRAAHFKSHARSAIIAGACAFPFAVLVLKDILDVMTLAEFSKSRETWVEGLHTFTITSTARFFVDVVRELGAVGLVVIGLIGGALSLRRVRRSELWIVYGYVAVLGLTLITYQNYARLFVPAIALLAVFGGHALAALSGVDAPKRLRIAWVTLALAALTGLPAIREIITFRGGGYPAMASEIEKQLEVDPGPAVAVAQQSLFPYLSAEACDQVFWITEPTGQEMVKDGAFRYLITDLDFEHHTRVEEHLAGFVERLELIAEVENPLPRAVLFDRLTPGALRRHDRDPDSDEFTNSTRLRLFRVRDR